MYKQSPSRTQRSKGFKVKHALQICLLLAVCFWLIYQVKHYHDKKRDFDEHDVKNSLDSVRKDNVAKLGRKDLHPLKEHTVVASDKHEEEVEEEDVEEETTVKQKENTHEEEGKENKAEAKDENGDGRGGVEEEVDDEVEEETTVEEEENKHEEEWKEHKTEAKDEKGEAKGGVEEEVDEEVEEEDNKYEEEGKENKTEGKDEDGEGRGRVEEEVDEEVEEKNAVEEEENNHEEEGKQNKTEAKDENDELRREREEEVDDHDQEKSETKSDREEDFVDEEKQQENDDESEPKNKEYTSSTSQKHDNLGGTTNRHEAREENYNADDASSAVTLYTKLTSNGNDSGILGKLNEQAKVNNLESRDISNNIDEGDAGQNASVNVDGEQTSHESHIGTPTNEQSETTISNSSVTEVSKDLTTPRNSAEVRGEVQDISLLTRNGTVIEQNEVSEEPKIVSGTVIEQNGNLQYSNSTISTESKSTDLEESHTHGVTNPSNFEMKYDLTSKAEGNSTMMENSSISENTEDDEEGNINKSLDESKFENSYDMKLDVEDSSDFKLSLEEKDVRTDLETLPDIKTEGGNSEDDDAAE